MKGVLLLILTAFLFAGCQDTQEQMRAEGTEQQSSDMGMHMGNVTEDVMGQLDEPIMAEETDMTAEPSEKAEDMAAGQQLMEEKIVKENSRQAGMIASVPDAEREKIINENRWGISIRDLEDGSTMYYDRNGNFLGKRK
ncbi:MAG: hypothetical protein JXD21_09055 [Candidatus Omnitrophica bacterium]|nr:hypothetical protein [Candidatus Omnitrophota bacterium]